jgi:hypothetical protein
MALSQITSSSPSSETPAWLPTPALQPLMFASAEGYPWLFWIALPRTVSRVGVVADLVQVELTLDR